MIFFKNFIKLLPLAIFYVLTSFDFVKIWGRGGCLKEATLKKNHFWHYLCLNTHTLAWNGILPNCQKMIVLVWHADAMYKISGHQHPQRPSYGGLKRVTVSRFSPILSIHIQMTISQAWGGLFQKFQSLKSIVWSAPSLDKGPRSTASKGVKL